MDNYCVIRHYLLKHSDNILFLTIFIEDVDECKLATDKCSQKCENTPGGYNCLCFFGFVLKDDRISCEEGNIFW